MCLLVDRCQDSYPSLKHLDIEKGNPAFQLPFYGKLNGGVLFVEVLVEGLQEEVFVGQMAKMSSIYLSHILGLHRDISKARVSRSFMKMFATIGESSEPMHCCSLYLLKDITSQRRWQMPR